jgi:tetratricopeptide (TPR) repeat protein
LAADGRKLLQFVEARIKEVSPSQAQAQAQARAAELYTLHDVAGRLYHDLGEPKSAIEPYTSALVANPASAGAFRNLGSAYQAVGNAQMAFASYQQAIQVDPTDALVYLKLAYFYEDFASKDWLDAADHAIRCYDYYLANVDCEDTAVLTRLGNLQVREHKSVEAIETYSRALRVDGGMANVWFNKAHAQVQIGDVGGARESLQQTLQLDPSIVAASHMLKALSPDEAQKVDRGDDKYVRELFDSYSASYDPHVKKLMYSAPRVIRQELAKIYRGRFTIDNAEETVPMNLPSERPGCTTIIPTIAINSTLEVKFVLDFVVSSRFPGVALML